LKILTLFEKIADPLCIELFPLILLLAKLFPKLLTIVGAGVLLKRLKLFIALPPLLVIVLLLLKIPGPFKAF